MAKRDAYKLKLNREPSENGNDDWLADELSRIAAAIGDGYQSGEIIGPDGERGWWDLTADDPA